METLPDHDELVQSLVEALSPYLLPFFKTMTLSRFVQQGDVQVRDALMEAAAKVAEQAFSQERPASGAYRKRSKLHSALGPLSLLLWGILLPTGLIRPPLDPGLVSHGCTMAVRQQCAVLHALGTTHDAGVAMRLFQANCPSDSTLYRVAVAEGLALRQSTSCDSFGPLLEQRVQDVAPQVSLIVVGADGGHVPMRGSEQGMGRQWHEGRVVTVTLLGAPDPSKPRTITLFDGTKREHPVGGERAVLAALTLGQMPTEQGPRSDRVEKNLMEAYRVLSAQCPDAKWQGLCDGGDWPEQTVDATVGKERRTTDICHASDHLLEVANSLFHDEERAKQWWAEERTDLLQMPGESGRLVQELTKLGATPGTEPIKSAGYFVKRAAHMAYAERLQAEEMIGSGPTEAAVKQLITVRMKRVGATWGHRGGEAVMHLRSLVISGLWEGAWRERIKKSFEPRKAAA